MIFRTHRFVLLLPGLAVHVGCRQAPASAARLDLLDAVPVSESHGTEGSDETPGRSGADATTNAADVAEGSDTEDGRSTDDSGGERLVSDSGHDETDVPVDGVADADIASPTTEPTGACADGLDLPTAGSPCAKEFESRCSRVGEKPVLASKTNLNMDTCVRPNRTRCLQTPGKGLTWTLDPCPKLGGMCGQSEYMSCRSDLGGASCCPHFIPQNGGKVPLAGAWRCSVAAVGHVACGGSNLFKCSTYFVASQALGPPYAQEVDAAYAECLPAEPGCIYYFPSQICPLLDVKLCSGWKETGTKNRYCAANYEGAGPACLMNCDDFKKYSKDYQPPKPK